MKSDVVREPAVAGMFYPGDARLLKKEIEDLLNRAKPTPVRGKLLALVSPHAGYMYSGLTAAHGFSFLRGIDVETVVIVAPSHREYFDGISVYNGSAYRTPFGAIEIDTSVRQGLVEGEDVIVESESGHRQEHAVEVQLPFVQSTVKQCKIVPIVMGDQRREYCYLLGEKLAAVTAGRNALLIASTDLSHYHPYTIAMKLDSIIMDEIARLDHDALMTTLEKEEAEACGGGPTVAVLLAAKKLGADKAQILHSCNSGDVTGDRSGVVGYLSAAITRPTQ
jgi:AmmeMemoRadiSam system protein B